MHREYLLRKYSTTRRKQGCHKSVSVHLADALDTRRSLCARCSIITLFSFEGMRSCQKLLVEKTSNAANVVIPEKMKLETSVSN